MTTKLNRQWHLAARPVGMIKIVLCGLIAQYNATQPVPGPYNFANILRKRARVEGFIVFDYMTRAQEANRDLSKWYAEGKLRYRVDVVEGLENAPARSTSSLTGRTWASSSSKYRRRQWQVEPEVGAEIGPSHLALGAKESEMQQQLAPYVIRLHWSSRRPRRGRRVETSGRFRYASLAAYRSHLTRITLVRLPDRSLDSSTVVAGKGAQITLSTTMRSATGGTLDHERAKYRSTKSTRWRRGGKPWQAERCREVVGDWPSLRLVGSQALSVVAESC